MVELLHWANEKPGNRTRAESPFWKAVREMVDNSDSLNIACPYLSPEYVEEVTEIDDWRLVTDVQAWMNVYGNRKQESIEKFIRENHENLKHYPGLHAKAVISDTTAMVGSANLTRNGIVENQELGVKIDQSDQITELRNWFDSTWHQGQPIENSILPTPEVTRKETADKVDKIDQIPPVFDRLVDVPRREWMTSLFNVMQDVIEELRLGEADPRLVVSAEQNDRFVVIVNQRYVCGGYFGSSPRIGFILTDDAPGVEEAISRSITHKYYQFTTRDGQNPHWVVFEGRPDTVLTDDLRHAWLSAAQREMKRGAKSPHADSHDSRVYRAIVNEEYRERILSWLFEDQNSGKA